VADAKLPGGHRVGPERLTVPGLPERLVKQLSIDCGQGCCPVPGRQRPEVVFH
jgi:hypothetical protein